MKKTVILNLLTLLISGSALIPNAFAFPGSGTNNSRDQKYTLYAAFPGKSLSDAPSRDANTGESASDKFVDFRSIELSNTGSVNTAVNMSGYEYFNQAQAMQSYSNSKTKKIPLYGLFEIPVENKTHYMNPFRDVDVNSVFTSPGGRKINFFGFYDGDGKGGQEGHIWKQRFMPDEVGRWQYEVTFTDGSPGISGEFDCVEQDAQPGFWVPDQDNPHWLKTIRGERFLPVAMFANCIYTPLDWNDAIDWCKANKFNTLITGTFNMNNWGSGWPNLTAFATANEANKEVDYSRMNLKMWQEWDQMIMAAGDAGIYIGPFEGPNGKYGGQERGKYPPKELVMNPGIKDRFNTERNLRIIRYFVARQGAFWNLAYWSLGGSEVYYYGVKDETEFIEYGEYIASITPWGRMITAQDCEQWHEKNRRWISKLNIPAQRKLNLLQTSIENPTRPTWGDASNEGGWVDQPQWQEAGLNNELVLDSYGGFPMITTEGLWEGQGRAKQPLRIIWGFLCAGGHVVWADWKYENTENHTYGSLGRGWIPIKPLDQHLFKPDQLGANCVGQKQLSIAAGTLQQFEYWKMNPANELVRGSDEAYCLAEYGKQYIVYAPKGGKIRINFPGAGENLQAEWLDPRTGERGQIGEINTSSLFQINAPDLRDWVLLIL